MIAKVYVSFIDYSVDKLYDYSVPPSLEDKVKTGTRVVVPFGKGNKKIEAVVIECESKSQIQKLKPILSIIDIVSKEKLDFAEFIKEHYFCTFYEALKLLLPPGLGLKFTEKISVNQEYLTDGFDDVKKNIYDYVKKDKEVEYSLLLDKFKNQKLILEELIKDGVFISNYFETDKVFDKTIKTVLAIDNKEKAEKFFSRGKRNQKLHKEIYELLLSGGAMSIKEICYITGCSAGVLNTMEKNGLIEIFEAQTNRSYYKKDNISKEIPAISNLNSDQSKAFEGIKELFDTNKACGALLFGVTGSGKTLVYLHLIDHIIKNGKTAILLVPEISLSPQIFSMFFKYFGSSVALLHSKMSIGERRDEFNRIKNKEVKIVIGTRMAVFADLENIGAIIIDEEQEHTYKSEQSPRYDAVQIAKYRCAKENALLLLGSATPSLESFYNAEKGRYKLFSLERRYGGALLPKVDIIDMSAELKEGNTNLISNYLIEQLRINILNNKQSILYLNRRGHSTFISCVECGHVIKCKNCSIPMRLHKKNNRLMCHYCGFSQSNIECCPNCGNTLIKFLGAGTQKIEEQILELLPDARVLRMDADTTIGKKSHDTIINEFNECKADILVGTQMITKGLDFENVTLVGVLNADLALYSDDFKASETTFSQITQVIGRAGRRNIQGRAIIQTITPDSQVLNFCKTADYEGFYNYEIGIRKLLIYPPFCDLVSLTVSSVYEDVADNMALELEKILKHNLNIQKDVKVIILGPAKPSISRVNNKYRNRTILKCKNNLKLRNLLKQVIFEFNKISKGRKTALIVDINPPSVI